MFLFLIIIIVIIIVVINNKQDEKWYSELTEEEKSKIRMLDLKLTEVNYKTKSMMPKKYKLYKMLYQLSNNLTKDEEILFFTKYITRVENLYNNTGPWGYVYITNKRFLTMDKQDKNVPIEKISSVVSSKNGVIITDNATSTKLLGIPKDDIIPIIKNINEQMENHKSIDINITKTTEKDVADKIARLKALFDEGILTEYEFNIKKMELLDKDK